ETCLKIGGYVRYEVQFEEGNDGWDKFGRATVTLDSRSETEMGTLRGFIELRFNSDSGFRGYTENDAGATALAAGNQSTELRNAFIELGGLFVGIKTT